MDFKDVRESWYESSFSGGQYGPDWGPEEGQKFEPFL